MNETRMGPDRRHEFVLQDAAATRPEDVGRTRSMLATGLALLAAGVALFLVWQTVSSLLIVFAGVLFAAFLDATALCGFGLVWGTGKLPEQTRLLLKVMDAQVDVLQAHLLSYGVDLLGPEWGRDFAQWLFADQGRFLSHAHFLLGGASSLLTAVLVILFLGVLFAFDPTAYRDSVVVLVRQSYRARARTVMDEMGNVMRLWFVGQLIRIILMTILVWIALYLIGLPGPFVLGLQAGLSNFIPYLGPIVAALPIALVAMPLGASLLIWAVVIYTIIQSIEGYVIGPLIQRHAVETPPAWTLVAIVLLGALFGIMGIAVAMPLVAIGRVAIMRFYVEDYLGDGLEAATIAGEQQ
jgi:predicted PurR-regulated permease PerM